MICCRPLLIVFSFLQLIVFASGFFISPCHVQAQETLPVNTENSINMTMGECVSLAVRDNVDVQIAYLDRVLEKYNLKTDTLYRYLPRFDVDGALKRSDTIVVGETTEHDIEALSATVTEHIPTGGDLAFTWANNSEHDLERGAASFSEKIDTDTWNVSFSQPLLKGAGVGYDLSFSRQAEITESINVLNLKQTLIDVATDSIVRYRQLLGAKHAINISKNTLKRANQGLEKAKAEIKFGRMAAMDLVQYESSVASQELALEQAKNEYNSARLNLTKQLNLDRSINIIPAENLIQFPVDPDEQNSIDIAMNNRPSLLIERLNLESAEYTLLRSKRDELPTLTFNSQYGKVDTEDSAGGSSHETDWFVGLVLSTPLFGAERRNLSSETLSAKSRVRSAQIELKKNERDAGADVSEQLQDIKTQKRTLELSTIARTLAEKKFEVEKEKLKAGLSSTFQVISFHDDLFKAQLSELRATISYLNSLTNFDQYLGTALDTWGIEFKHYRAEAEEEIGKVN
ncbi:MAG: TolC family protein [Desulfobulbaceae bacterium]|nr:TolC family protein [Desulfobulbaceae bacterium]